MGHEHCGGLVENQDVGTAIEHLQNFDTLSLTHSEFAHHGVGVEVDAECGGQFGDASAASSNLMRAPATDWLVTKDDVFEDREVVGQL